jgi:glycolate oxidase FAD binding subunit
LDWPDTPTGDPLGDDRFAWATDRPGTVEALREAVAQRVAQGYALYPQGGGTALDYGGVPRTPGVAIDVRGLDRVIDYPAADMTITVEAGLTLAALQETLARHRQRLPLDAPHPGRATLGGIYATNTSGPRRFGAGRPRDLIIGVSFVTADGLVVKGGGRVVKNVAGYDLPKLLTGSMGTLGILCQMTLKVRPAPAASALALVPFTRAEALGLALDRLNTSATRPIALEVLNRSAARHVAGARELPGAAWVLAVGFEDNAAAVAWQLDALARELEIPRTGLRVLQGDEAAAGWSDLAELPAAAPGPLSVVANLRPSTVVPFAAQLDPDRWAVGAHAGNGIVRAHALGAMTLEDLIPELDRLRAEAVRDGGNLLLARCPTPWKGILPVWGEPRGDWALAERVKRALDPPGVMNPGRFVGTI